MEILKSTIDKSVNFVSASESGEGYFESRFVQRTNDYFIAYVSSQSGCNQACRMCHLTATKQTRFINATPKIFFDQIEPIFEYFKSTKNEETKLVHFNFMARGEPLDNLYFLNYNHSILDIYRNQARSLGLNSKFKISTILPSSVAAHGGLYKIFNESLRLGIIPEIYYSIYSTDETFRKKWLPRAAPVNVALNMLKEWQEKTSLIPKLHFAFIKGENDSLQDIYNLIKAVKDANLKVNINIVRYNPYSEIYGEESNEEIIKRNARILSDILDIKVKIIPRVGEDVYASCGTFYPKAEKTDIKFKPNADTLKAMECLELENFRKSIEETLKIIGE